MEIKDFESLITLGQVRRTVTLGGHEISMHTLSSLEYAQMNERLGDKTKSEKFEAVQREIVCSAVDLLDGKLLSHADKLRIFGEAQLGLSNMLYGVYTDMIQEQEKLIDDAKKKSSPGNLS